MCTRILFDNMHEPIESKRQTHQTADCRLAGLRSITMQQLHRQLRWCWLTLLVVLSKGEDEPPELALTTKDKLFSLGAQKTATTTTSLMLATLLPKPSNLPNRTACCHNVCPSPWYVASEKHKEDGVLANFNCFSDNGNQADWHWLLKKYENSRYMLSIRDCTRWKRSYFKHVAAARIGRGCKPIGTKKDCDGHFTDNKPEHVNNRCKMFERHNHRVIEDFTASHDLLNRFAVLNATKVKPREWWLIMAWLARADLNQYRTTKLISCEQDIPKGFITAALKMFQEMAIDPHLAPRISRTEEILENLRRNSTNSEAKEKYEKLKSWLQSDQSDFPESVDHFAKHTGPDIAQKDT